MRLIQDRIKSLLTAYFLVSHGSSDPRHLSSLKKVGEIFQNRLTSPVGVGTLEVTSVSLHEQLVKFANDAISLGLIEVQIFPLFLLPGVHVQEDIPSEVRIAQEVLGERIKLNLLPHLGSKIERLTPYLYAKMNPFESEIKWIIFSHGTKRWGGNQSVEEIARIFNASIAYWSISPHLEEEVINLVKKGYIHLGIFPYFLFSGGITDKISLQVEQFRFNFPGVKFSMSSPLEPTPQLVDIMVELILVQ